jgi:hypothetical protein
MLRGPWRAEMKTNLSKTIATMHKAKRVVTKNNYVNIQESSQVGSPSKLKPKP